MLRYYIIMCRSLTYAQRAVRVLERNGLFAALAKAPQEMTAEGCNYGVKIRIQDIEISKRLLRGAGIKAGRVIGLDDFGRGSEVTV